jgi:hypothetical protein
MVGGNLLVGRATGRPMPRASRSQPVARPSSRAIRPSPGPWPRGPGGPRNSWPGRRSRRPAPAAIAAARRGRLPSEVLIQLIPYNILKAIVGAERVGPFVADTSYVSNIPNMTKIPANPTGKGRQAASLFLINYRWISVAFAPQRGQTEIFVHPSQITIGEGSCSTRGVIVVNDSNVILGLKDGVSHSGTRDKTWTGARRRAPAAGGPRAGRGVDFAVGGSSCNAESHRSVSFPGRASICQDVQTDHR